MRAVLGDKGQLVRGRDRAKDGEHVAVCAECVQQSDLARKVGAQPRDRRRVEAACLGVKERATHHEAAAAGHPSVRAAGVCADMSRQAAIDVIRMRMAIRACHRTMKHEETRDCRQAQRTGTVLLSSVRPRRAP
jgi:hypothetical protein